MDDFLGYGRSLNFSFVYIGHLRRYDKQALQIVSSIIETSTAMQSDHLQQPYNSQAGSGPLTAARLSLYGS